MHARPIKAGLDTRICVGTYRSDNPMNSNGVTRTDARVKPEHDEEGGRPATADGTQRPAAPRTGTA